MILKILNYREGKNQSNVYDEWDYFDNIVNAKSYFDENITETVVFCQFRDGNKIEFIIRYVAYLMSDEGKTIERVAASDTIAATVESKTKAKI